MTLWDSASNLALLPLILMGLAILVALAFECINGFHDTANAVTTVIYTRSLPAIPAVVFSGFMNFAGVIIGGTAVAFGIVNLLPSAVLQSDDTTPLLVMVMSLLIAAVCWNLGTWYFGIPVSSSHTLIGSIFGVALANSLAGGLGLGGVNWSKFIDTAQGLFVAPVIGFVCSAVLLLVMRAVIRVPRLYVPPVGEDKPPLWIRAVLVFTCGSVSFSHGSNDGQKGMGLILLVLLGFLPTYYHLSPAGDAAQVANVVAAARELRPAAEAATAADAKAAGSLAKDLAALELALDGKTRFHDVPADERRAVRKATFAVEKALKKPETAKLLEDAGAADVAGKRKILLGAVEHVPLWVVISVALALGVGTTFGYQRIVETVAHKIGKTPLTYAQGAAAELVAALTIGGASYLGLPVSTTQVVSSGIAGTMVANGNGVQGPTVRKILIAWFLTLPATMLLSGSLYTVGRLILVK